MSDALEFRQLRAPRQHGGTLVEPPFRDISSQVDRNSASLASFKYDVQGKDWSVLREEARTEIHSAAHAYTSGYLSIPTRARDPVGRLLLAGHQPELFHPGVWFKNFALDQLAEQLGGAAAGTVALNLVVDNDLARATSIRAPAQGAQRPFLARIPLDQAGGDIPYEQRGIIQQELFDTFPSRVEQALRPFQLNDPRVTRLWPFAREGAARTNNLGLALAQSRHQLESRWGSRTLELPISVLSDTRAFRWFACHLLTQLPQLHRHYNQALHDYRVAHGIRSRSHPVADLDEQQGWLEAPLWMWSDEEPWRRPVFARSSGREIEVTDRRHVLLRLPVTQESPAERGVEFCEEVRRRGIRIRPRALLTTMFARLVCSDLFLHGIGGAKYDQLTDEIMRRFFGIDPPGYMTLSATILLPVEREDVTADDLRRLERLLRELRFHPEKYAPESDYVRALTEKKQAWIAKQVLPSERKSRHQTIEGVNQALQPLVEPTRQQLRSELQDWKERLRVTNLLASREFSFCLFPEAPLRNMLGELLREQL